ncbi:hypothetical protein [Neolewinella persica]|uniref:hypothetical protein n=1 Tax=Neolewinella persica TaxID=70998 RepID=UPI0003A8921F|nr:hypothetical protein [Neolewinella persica]
MSLPHAPPPPPSIDPIGALLAPRKETVGEANFLAGISILIVTIIALVNNANDTLPISLLVVASFLMFAVLRLVNKGRQDKFVTTKSRHRNYLLRFAYRVIVSLGLLIAALLTFFLYPLGWVSVLTGICLLRMAAWNVKAPDLRQSFIGTNSLNNYWKRITGKAAFNQLDYGQGDTVRFSYEDGLSRNSSKQYDVFLNRILECRFDLANDGHITWEREVLWSAHQRVSPDQLSQGLAFPIRVDSEETITPTFYRLLYWEVILQEVDGTFLERFLVGVDQFRKVGMERAEALRA